MSEPEIISPGGGLIGGLIAAITALGWGLAEFLRWRKKDKPDSMGDKPNTDTNTSTSANVRRDPAQLDRIESRLALLERVLVIPTRDGGHVTASRELADNLNAKLDELNKKLERRIQLKLSTADVDKLDTLVDTVESLCRQVEALVDIVRGRT